MDLSALKKTAFIAIENEKEEIFSLSMFINGNPETAYHEKLACAAVSEFLQKRGFRVETGTGGLETSFNACYPDMQGSCSAVPAAFIAEYDALPDVGHGCGHNLIAAAAVAAGIGTAAAVNEAQRGSFRIIGTPAEEIMTEAAGKNRLIKAGVFDGIGNCLMFHPWHETGVAEKDLGCTAFRFVFNGRTAHAAADPWNGRNALDAAVLFYNSLSMLRQQLHSGFKLHCIIPEGGNVLNVIPEHAVVEVMLRSTELEELIDVEGRIRECADSAAHAAGCDCGVEKMAAVKPILFDRRLFDLVSANMKAMGESLDELPIWEASSDFGDVSREVPSLSLLYKTHNAETPWHSAAAAKEAASAQAAEEMLRAAKILAATAIDLVFS